MHYSVYSVCKDLHLRVSLKILNIRQMSCVLLQLHALSWLDRFNSLLVLEFLLGVLELTTSQGLLECTQYVDLLLFIPETFSADF